MKVGSSTLILLSMQLLFHTIGKSEKKKEMKNGNRTGVLMSLIVSKNSYRTWGSIVRVFSWTEKSFVVTDPDFLVVVLVNAVVHALSEDCWASTTIFFCSLRNHNKLKEHLYTELFLILMAFFNQLRTAIASPIYS